MAKKKDAAEVEEWTGDMRDAVYDALAKGDAEGAFRVVAPYKGLRVADLSPTDKKALAAFVDAAGKRADLQRAISANLWKPDAPEMVLALFLLKKLSVFDADNLLPAVETYAEFKFAEWSGALRGSNAEPTDGQLREMWASGSLAGMVRAWKRERPFVDACIAALEKFQQSEGKVSAWIAAHGASIARVLSFQPCAIASATTAGSASAEGIADLVRRGAIRDALAVAATAGDVEPQLGTLKGDEAERLAALLESDAEARAAVIAAAFGENEGTMRAACWIVERAARFPADEFLCAGLAALAGVADWREQTGKLQGRAIGRHIDDAAIAVLAGHPEKSRSNAQRSFVGEAAFRCGEEFSWQELVERVSAWRAIAPALFDRELPHRDLDWHMARGCRERDVEAVHALSCAWFEYSSPSDRDALARANADVNAGRAALSTWAEYMVNAPYKLVEALCDDERFRDLTSMRLVESLRSESPWETEWAFPVVFQNPARIDGTGEDFLELVRSGLWRAGRKIDMLHAVTRMVMLGRYGRAPKDRVFVALEDAFQLDDPTAWRKAADAMREFRKELPHLALANPERVRELIARDPKKHGAIFKGLVE